MDFEFLWDDMQLFSPSIANSSSLDDLPKTPGSVPQQTIPTGSLNDLALSRPDSDATCPGRPSISTVPGFDTGEVPRLPPMEPENPVVAAETHPARPWKISAVDYREILKGLSRYQRALPATFGLRSRHALSRFLEGYFRGFHIHMPFLHCVTFSTSSVDAVLVLSLAAVGALCRFERAKGYQLYEAARSMIRWRLEEWTRCALDRLTSDSPQAGDGSSEARIRETSLQLLQAMIVLMAMASWDEKDLVADGLSMTSHVATLARKLGIDEPEPEATRDLTWEHWVVREGRRRTLYVAYVMLNLQSVAFDVPPLILNHAVAMDMPSCASTWRAANSTEWFSLADRYVPPEPFRKKMDQLLSGGGMNDSPQSSFGNSVLAHGVLQHISLARTVFGGRGPGQDFIAAMEAALRGWKESWEATYESTRDPSSPKGPMGFDSLRGDERRLVDMPQGLVQETELGDSMEGVEDPEAEVKMLASLTLQLWAQTSKGSHAPQIVHRVGKCLGVLADLPQAQQPRKPE